MPQTHDSFQIDLHIGPLRLFVHSVFWHIQHYPDPRIAFIAQPLVEHAEVFEDEHPWRTSVWARTLRFPGTRRALVVGYWDLPDPARTESAMWTSAAGDSTGMIPGIGVQEIVDWTRPEREPEEGSVQEVEDGVYLVDGVRISLDRTSAMPATSQDPSAQFVHDGVERLARQPRVVERIEIPIPSEVAERAAEGGDVGVGPVDQGVRGHLEDPLAGGDHGGGLGLSDDGAA